MLTCSAGPTLLNHMDCSLPGSSVHGILQARTLEWVAIPFSRDLPDPVIDLACRWVITHTTWEAHNTL